MDQKKIVIIGGGFGGVRVALDLVNSHSDARITLINKNPNNCFYIDLYEIATAILETEKRIDFHNLSSSANIPLRQIFKDKQIQILIDEVTDIDLNNQKVLTKIEGEVEYDYLVIAMGSETNYYGIKNAQEYSHSFKSVEDALNVRNDISELILNSKKPINLVIAGGGFTGVELAGSMVGFVTKLAKKYKKDIPIIKIVEGSEMVLNGMPKWAQIRAYQRLQQLDVEVVTNFKIKTIHQNLIISDQEKTVGYDYLIWTTGIKGTSIENPIKGVSLNSRGQIPTSQDLSIAEAENVFVIGDLSECMDLKRGCPISTTAWAAISQAQLVAKNIKLKMKNQPAHIYQAPGPIFIVPIGHRFALSDLYSFKLAGWDAWLLKKIVNLKYFLSILPLFEAINLWRRGVSIYLKND